MLETIEKYLRIVVLTILIGIGALMILGVIDFINVGKTEGWHAAWGESWHLN